MANSKRVALNSDDWEKLSDGNKTVKIQPLQSAVYVYLTDSNTDPDDSADKDSYVLEPKSGYYEFATALKVYAKKQNVFGRKCDIIYISE